MAEVDNFKVLSINDLPNECLLRIFKFLPIRDRLLFERVSKRWQSLLLESLRKIKAINLDCDFHSDDGDFTYAEVNALQKVLQLCGPFLKYIRFEHDCIESSKPVLLNIHNLCPNVEAIALEYSAFRSLPRRIMKRIVNNFTELRSFSAFGQDFETGNALAQLFERNRKLKSLEFVECIISAKCFSHLQHEVLESLTLTENTIDSIHLLVNDIRKFRNLRVLNLNMKVENISEFNLINEIIKAANPKALDTLYISLLDRRNVLDQCQCDYFPINRFTNLIELYIYGNLRMLHDRNLQAIAESCPRLIKINLKNAVNVTDHGFTYIANSLPIQYLDLHEINVSDQTLSIMKSLKVLKCSLCPHIKNDGLMTLIETSRNLKRIELDLCSTVNPEGLTNSIKRSPARVLEVRTDEQYNLGSENIRKYFKFSKVGNRISKKIEIKCSSYGMTKKCNDQCTVCSKQEKIYYVE